MTPAQSSFDQGTVGFGSLQWDVDDQSRWLAVVEKMIDLFSQFEEAAVVPGHGCVR